MSVNSSHPCVRNLSKEKDLFGGLILMERSSINLYTELVLFITTELKTSRLCKSVGLSTSTVTDHNSIMMIHDTILQTAYIARIQVHSRCRVAISSFMMPQRADITKGCHFVM